MTTKDDFIYIIRNLREKHRLSIRKKNTDKEVWYVYISIYKLLSIIIGGVAIFLIIIATTFVYTPLLDLLPGYPGSKSRDILISNIMRIDSMEQEIRNISSYVDNRSLIINGGTPASPSSTPNIDSIYKQAFKAVAPSIEDAILRAQLDSVGVYQLPKSSTKNMTLLAGANLMSPVNGLVVTKFNPSKKRYGVEIATAGNKPIMAIKDGSVVLATWTPELGNIIQIQHNGNLISTYKNTSHILHNIGDIVKSGEVIGYTGGGISGDENKDLISFEIWSNGIPVDPEKYVWF